MVLWIGFSGISYSQNLERPTFNDPVWNVKVKQLDDFLDRFNNQTKYFQNNSTVTHELSEEMHLGLLWSLVNIQDTLLINDFISTVVKDKGKNVLSFYEGSWFSEIEIEIRYFEQIQKISLIMKMEKSVTGGHKWVLASVKEPDKNWLNLNDNPEKFINPTNHNLRFSRLQRHIDGSDDILGLLPNDWEIDYMSIFLYLVSRGDIELLRVNKIKYHFLQIENFIFTVEYFDRPTLKSGWLISEIITADTLAKKRF
jgi:hypothetical protein